MLCTKFSLLCGSYKMVHSAHALMHLSEDALHHGALDIFSCFLYESIMRLFKFEIQEYKNRAQQLYRRSCESITLDYAFTNALSDDVSDSKEHSRGQRHPFLIRNTVLADTSCNNDVTVAEKPASMAGLE